MKRSEERSQETIHLVIQPMAIKKSKLTGIRKAGILAGMSLFLLAFFPLFVRAETVDISLTYGFGNTAKSGQLLPVSVSFTNNSSETVDGFLSLEISGTDETFSYTSRVSIPSGGLRVKRTVTVPDAASGQNSDFIKARLFDDSGIQISSSEIQVRYQGNGEEAFIGILSDQTASLEYLGNLSLTEQLTTRAIALDAEDLPEDAEGLDQLDLIVISGFAMEKLSAEVTEAIIGWVEKGGTLLLGTGRAARPLGNFEEFLSPCTLENSAYTLINMGTRYSKTDPNGAKLLLFLRRISWSGAELLELDADKDLLWSRSFEKGSVCLCCADLCDLSDFSSEHPGFSQDLLLAVLGQTGISRILAGLTDASERLQAAQALTNTFSEDKVPSSTVYLVFAVTYVFAAGSILFRVLKQRGLGIYYMLGVVILSTASTLLCWLLSSSTRVIYPYIDYGLITEYSGQTKKGSGSASATNKGFLNFGSPNQSAMTLELPEQCTVRPVMISGNSSLTEGKKQMLAVTGQKQFEKNIYQIEEETGSDVNTLPLTVSLTSTEDGISGTITNTGTHAFRGLSLVTWGSAIRLGALEPGQSVSFSEKDLVYGPMSVGSLCSRYLTAEETELACLDQKKSLIEYELSESVALEEGKLLILGFADEYTPDFLLSDKYTLHGSTLVVMEEKSEEPAQGTFTRMLAGSAVVLSGTYDSRTNTISGGAEVILELVIGGEFRVEEISMQELSSELSGEEVTKFRGQISLYHYGKGQFDPLSSDKTILQAEELKEYLSPANTLIIRYTPEEQQRSSLPMYLPLVMAKLTGVSSAEGPAPVQ